MKRLIIFCLSFLLFLNLYSHPWKPSHYVIIDTDGGIDDIRAITLLLASPDVRVLAITTTSGALDAGHTYIKVKSLLNSFYHEGVPVGINRNFDFKSPLFPAALNAKWGEEESIDQLKAPDCIALIREILEVEKTRISFVCLGGMNTAYTAIKEIPSFKKQVREIIWSTNGLRDIKGFNYNVDKESAGKVIKEDIPVRAVRNFGDEKFFDEKLIKEISGVNTVYSKKISQFFSSQIENDHSYSYTGNDEMIPLYIHFPVLFKTDTIGKNSESTPAERELIKKGTLKILKGETVPKNQVIKEFPDDPAFYSDDLKSSVNEIIKKYGIDEWISGVIANELHRHLGVFAIVGVKMGIRAREYFNTGVDEFSATSFAGSVPPLSCMNDGIQVSTGATPGHGLLTVRNDTVLSPMAEFTYMNHKIRVSLKSEIAEKISSELKEINFVYGLDSNIYWELVRKNTIKYWLNLDRHDIFIIEIIR